ncbi:PEP-CTERM/exosortase A-associated glycosyltransferase [compost metagenome]
MRKTSVLVVQRRLPHYRVRFFSQLREELHHRGIAFHLAYGQPTPAEEKKNDSGTLEWATPVPTRYFLGGRLCWLQQPSAIKDADLLVLTPENKILSNLPLQYFSSRQKVVLWGHGANLQGDPSSLRERFKRIVARKADWWFAYTALSLPLISRTGFPPERVSVLQNAVDTSELAALHSAVTGDAQDEIRRKYGLRTGPVGAYIGSLYTEKRIDFLLEASLQIRKQVPDFQLLVIGDGPLRSQVDRFCQEHQWAHAMGIQIGANKVSALSLAKVILNPGLVGLGILDSFVCGVPMVTTDCGLHSPEISYLEPGANGIMSENSIEDYVGKTCKILTDPQKWSTLHMGCKASSSLYTLDNMVKNFADGIEHCAAAPMRR